MKTIREIAEKWAPETGSDCDCPKCLRTTADRIEAAILESMERTPNGTFAADYCPVCGSGPDFACQCDAPPAEVYAKHPTGQDARDFANSLLNRAPLTEGAIAYGMYLTRRAKAADAADLMCQVPLEEPAPKRP